MANASKRHIGPGAHGKGSGTGGNTELDKDMIEENMVLSNRDKSQRPDGRGLDSKEIQTEQLQDHSGARLPDDDAGDARSSAKAS